MATLYPEKVKYIIVHCSATAEGKEFCVKATTEEHLGFTGEGLGIAAHAVALIEKL